MKNKSTTDEIIRLIFPTPLPRLQELETRYPERNLQKGAEITRVGPSPTGLVHIGTIYVSLLCQFFARQTSGTNFLRIEDTDRKRELSGAVDGILNAFERFQIDFDEGPRRDQTETGSYGPYIQSRRAEIYQTITAELLSRRLAYVCFASTDELDKMRKSQKIQNLKPGYYGKWATWRDRQPDEVLQKLKSGDPYVVRYRTDVTAGDEIDADDLIYGTRRVAANDQDVIIMKSDRLPTYHLAHVVDDHFMRTTLIIRGNEWLASLPLHLQMFTALGWEAPRYAHIAPISILDGTTRRKLSKRKDPEAGVTYFTTFGYPPEALTEYLLGLASSDFEPWRDANPEKLAAEFELTFERLQSSNGPLFSFDKLDSVSRDLIARMPGEDVYERLSKWAENFDSDFAQTLAKDRAYSISILNIERGGERARKDIAKWSDVKDQIAFFYDELFHLEDGDLREALSDWTASDIASAVSSFLKTYKPTDDRDIWFSKIKQAADENGFAIRSKDYKRNPDQYRGTIAHFTRLFRVLLTGKPQSPDLYSILQVLGQDRVQSRLEMLQLTN